MKKITQQISVLKQYARKNEISIILTIMDYVLCRIFHGYCLDDYVLNTPGYFVSWRWRKDFFSFRRWKRVLSLANDSKAVYLIDNKGEALKHFAPFIKHKWLYPQESTFEEFKNFMSSNNVIISKPVTSIYGLGVSVLHYSRDCIDDKWFKQMCEDNILLEECIKQHHLLFFGNTSVNTIRVYSVLDQNGQPHILKSILRVGVGESIVDNFHAGGVIYPINIEYGIIESFGEQKNSDRKFFYHPGTNKCMLGYAIPSWEKVIQIVKEAHVTLPTIRYIGWDIVVLENGEVDIIEANSNADHALFSRIGYDKLFFLRIQELLDL